MPATNAAAAIPNNAERPGVVAVANWHTVFRDSAATGEPTACAAVTVIRVNSATSQAAADAR